jgi:ribosomal protein L40E
MLLNIIPVLIFLPFITIFYKKRLQTITNPTLASLGAIVLSFLSLNPIGLFIGTVGMIALPKLKNRGQSFSSSICAKCGTLSNKGEATCRQCDNILH